MVMVMMMMMMMIMTDAAHPDDTDAADTAAADVDDYSHGMSNKIDDLWSVKTPLFETFRVIFSAE